MSELSYCCASFSGFLPCPSRRAWRQEKRSRSAIHGACQLTNDVLYQWLA
ncbi:hypothetical protein C4K26_4089 [Pseudomonas chlororaphis]|nr:hypothetical protein C4K26_4089 [Pseudomonas chlororaphis]